MPRLARVHGTGPRSPLRARPEHPALKKTPTAFPVPREPRGDSKGPRLSGLSCKLGTQRHSLRVARPKRARAQLLTQESTGVGGGQRREPGGCEVRAGPRR